MSSGTTARRDRGRALRPGLDRPAPRAGTSCRARRPSASSAASTRRCRRRRPTGSPSCWSPHGGGTVDRRRHRWSARPRRAARSPSPADLPARVTGIDDRRGRRPCAHLRGGRLRGRGRRARRSPRSSRRGGPTSPTRTTWSRRSSGSSATTRSRRCCRTAPAGRGLTRDAAAAPPGRPHAGRRRLRRGDQLPVRRAGRLRRARPARRRRPPHGAAARQPAQRRGAAPDHHAAARPAGGGRAQRRPRPGRRRAVRGRDRHPAARVGSPRRSCPVDRRPTEEEWDDLQKALPEQPLHLAVVLAGERERAGWWGTGRRAGWADAIEAVRDVAAALGVEVDVRAAGRARRGTRAGAPSCWSASVRARSRRRAAPEGLPGVRPAGARRPPPRSTSTC